MAREAAGQRLARLARLEAAIAQLGARLRRLEESTSARASALEERVGRLERSLGAADKLLSGLDARDGPAMEARKTAFAVHERTMNPIQLLLANGISLHEDVSKSYNQPPAANETKQHCRSVHVENCHRRPVSGAASESSPELLRAAGRGDVGAMRHCLERGADLRARFDLAPLDAGADPRLASRGGRTPLRSPAGWGHAPFVEVLLLEGASAVVQQRPCWLPTGDPRV